MPHGADASWGLFFTSLSRHRDAEKLHKGFIVYCSVKLKPLNKQVAEQFCEVIRSVSEVTECYNISLSAVKKHTQKRRKSINIKNMPRICKRQELQHRFVHRSAHRMR